jgi:signal transduction histidine kinase
VSLVGWILAAAAALRVRELARRLELVARAEHELRGPLGALGLVAAAVARDPSTGRLSAALDSQLDRARGGLADLTAARRGIRASARPELVPLERAAAGAAWATGPVRIDWRAGGVAVRADRRRLAQAFGNLLQNAAEHGGGDVTLRSRRSGARVLVEIANRRRDRGRGLSIAAAAVEEAGGRLRVIPGGGETTVAVELPVDER